MREIKFRAWSKKYSRMIYPGDESFVINIDSYGDMHYLSAGVIVEEHPDIMQYTGLKDKNGKEIYEGDVCIDSDGVRRLVQFEYGFWSWEYWEDPSQDWQIIGNIHENPELLEA